ncbi:hypothetical protein [Martelella sp. AD-3]|uniref:hypothetical protein n=1 Tax=Martelella sp. AD-3 TaxID=686597 RepID=UPI0004678542|nr:hypothetical protein [Martelella sp. AD-3]AMM86382.1 hypothetical protein AZF01_20275 [Martelella sp. AD-3]
MNIEKNKSAELVGIGIYSSAEASRLTSIPAPKLVRWLSGYKRRGKDYPPLWNPEIAIEDEKIYLSFRDLMEVRVADAFVRFGMPPQHIRRAILLAREVLGKTHPLSTNRFRTDGRSILLFEIEKDENGEEKEKLLNLFSRQYEFREVIDPVLRTVDFGNEGDPIVWWPLGRRSRILIDPQRAFGQPIDAASGVPTTVLANAVRQEGGIHQAARVYDVSESAVREALEFEEKTPNARMAA